jgi:hypothetical protein
MLSKNGTDAVPMFAKAGRGIRVSHREYLQDVITSGTTGAFSIVTYEIQPALASSFPWLSSIAEQFVEYEINGMIYEFKSNSYDALASTNTASGTVVMTTQYNVLAEQFVNKQQMEQYEFTCSSKPSVNLTHPVECAKAESPIKVLTIRNGVAPGDLRLYDFANFNLATVGMQGASTNIGELWVSYDITFYKPRLGGTVDLADHYSLLPLNSVATGGTAYFGTSPTLSSSSDLGSELGTNTIIIPPTYTGNFQVWYLVKGGSGAITGPTLTASGGITALNILSGGINGTSSASLGTTGQMSIVQLFSAVAGGTITFSGGTSLGSVTSADLLISSIPFTLIN